jgi:hypothetical protein
MSLINQPPDGPLVNMDRTVTPGWRPFLSAVFQLLAAMTQSGTTVQRPTTFLWVGRNYFDTTLGIPIWYEGPAWVDATGAPV